MYSRCLAFNLLSISGVRWQMFNGVDDDVGGDNEGDIDWNRQECIGDVDKWDWRVAYAEINLSLAWETTRACP